jgi:activator of HSP90 ATPase
METLQHHRAVEAFCRQRAKMDGEDELFWLTEAEVLAKLLGNAHRREVLQNWRPDVGQEESSPR